MPAGDFVLSPVCIAVKEAHHWGWLAKLKLTWLACVCLVQNGWITWFSEGQCSGRKFEAARTGFLIARHVGIASAGETWCLLSGGVG